MMGIIAGGTIFIGLPIGRLRARGAGLRALLNAITVGVLLFLLWDVLAHAVEPVDAALTAASSGGRSWWPFAGLSALLFIGLAVGLLGLVAYDRWIAGRPTDEHRPVHGVLRLGAPASRLAFLIAVGIGMHNFSEGLAIGQSAAAGQLQLAVTLVVGFALHNATEGFGITAPMAASATRPKWRQLAVLGVSGGGPTLIGTLLGSVVVNDALGLVFLALAAGSIVYVLVQLVGVALKMNRGYVLYIGILVGLVAGFATDFIISAAGA